MRYFKLGVLFSQIFQDTGTAVVKRFFIVQLTWKLIINGNETQKPGISLHIFEYFSASVFQNAKLAFPF